MLDEFIRRYNLSIIVGEKDKEIEDIISFYKYVFTCSTYSESKEKTVGYLKIDDDLIAYVIKHNKKLAFRDNGSFKHLIGSGDFFKHLVAIGELKVEPHIIEQIGTVAPNTIYDRILKLSE